MIPHDFLKDIQRQTVEDVTRVIEESCDVQIVKAILVGIPAKLNAVPKGIRTAFSGQTFSAKLPYATTAASGRTVVRGEVSVTVTPGTACVLATTLETYDTTTGVTHVFFAGPELQGSGFGR